MLYACMNMVLISICVPEFPEAPIQISGNFPGTSVFNLSVVEFNRVVLCRRPVTRYELADLGTFSTGFLPRDLGTGPCLFS